MQLTQPMVSVIVPVYKVERYLEQCLVSIVHQSYRNLEILLVDDGSPDNCPQLCDMWAQRDSRIHVIHKPNGGLSDARNAGLRQAHGDLVAFVDSDDWIALDMIEKMTDAMLRNQADMVICQYVVAYADGRFEKRAPENGPEEVINRQQALSELLIDGRLTNHVWRKLYWRNKIPKDVFPKGRNFEDIYVMPELFAPCEKFVYITDPLYFYRCNENGIVQTAKIKDLRDCLVAQEHSGEVIADICPSLVQQVEICSVWKTVGLWMDSVFALDSAQEKCSFQKQLNEKLKHAKLQDIKILGKRKQLALLFIQHSPALARGYSKVLGKDDNFLSDFKKSLRLVRHNLRLKKEFKRDIPPKFVILCAPTYGNLGDQALLKGEQRFIEKYFPDYKSILISLDDSRCVKWLKNVISPNDIIALQAGGNIGTLYLGFHNAQESAMQIFAHKKLMIFPQTFYYSTDTAGRKALEKTRTLYDSFETLKVFVRDPASERFVQENLPSTDVALMPDMVLMNRPQVPHKKREGVLVCLRGDLEATLSTAERDRLLTQVETRFSKIRQTDTHVYYAPKDDAEVQILLNQNWAQMAESELVITDRLHGMVFALLTGTPCVTILSKSPKVEGVYNEWLKDNKMIKIIHSLDEFPQAVEEVLPHHDEPLNLEKADAGFDEMAKEIKKMWKVN